MKKVGINRGSRWVNKDGLGGQKTELQQGIKRNILSMSQHRSELVPGALEKSCWGSRLKKYKRRRATSVRGFRVWIATLQWENLEKN